MEVRELDLSMRTGVQLNAVGMQKIDDRYHRQKSMIDKWNAIVPQHHSINDVCKAQ